MFRSACVSAAELVCRCRFELWRGWRHQRHRFQKAVALAAVRWPQEATRSFLPAGCAGVSLAGAVGYAVSDSIVSSSTRRWVLSKWLLAGNPNCRLVHTGRVTHDSITCQSHIDAVNVPWLSPVLARVYREPCLSCGLHRAHTDTAVLFWVHTLARSCFGCVPCAGDTHSSSKSTTPYILSPAGFCVKDWYSFSRPRALSMRCFDSFACFASPSPPARPLLDL